MLRVQSLNKEEIYGRIGHIAVAYKHYIVVWGGFKASVAGSTYCLPNFVWMYNCFSEIWTVAETSGDVPAFLSGSTGLVLDNHLYIFGGVEELFPETGVQYICKISRLSLLDFKWEILHPRGEEALSCDKGVGWVYKDKLYFFGGYGNYPETQNAHRTYQFSIDPLMHRKGWNNRLICYDPAKNLWDDVKTTGPTPSPRAAHSCDIVSNKVYIFGGRLFDERLNDLHILDMDKLNWSGNVLSQHDGPTPTGMSWNTFTAIDDETVIVYGGLSNAGIPNTLWWILKMSDNKYTWKSRDLPESLVWHTAVFSKCTNEIIIVGGISSSPFSMHASDHCDYQILIQIAPRSLFRECLIKIVDISKSNKMFFEGCKEVIKTMPVVLQDVVNKRIIQGPEYKLILNL